MFKVKGVIIFPATCEEVLQSIADVSSEYQAIIDHLNGPRHHDRRFECTVDDPLARKAVESAVVKAFRNRVGILIEPVAVKIGELPRSKETDANPRQPLLRGMCRVDKPYMKNSVARGSVPHCLQQRTERPLPGQ